MKKFLIGFLALAIATSLFVGPQQVLAEDTDVTTSARERVARSFDGSFDLRSPDDEVKVFIQLEEPSVSDLAAHGATPTLQRQQGLTIQDQQAAVKSDLDGMILEEQSSLVVSANGFRAVVRAGDIPAIRATEGVKSVGPVVVHYPANASSVPWIGGSVVHAAGLTGDGVSIAIIDTGVDYTHESFGGAGTVGAYNANDPNVVEAGTFPTAKVVEGWDFAGPIYDPASALVSENTPDPDADPLDVHGHGTHVAGSAAGNSGASTPPGVAPDAEIWALKVFGDIAAGTELVSDAIEFALDPNGDFSTADHVDVINMSLGSPFGHPLDPSAIAAANAADLGVVVVASAGNEGPASYITGSPAVADGVISVAASTDGTDAIASFSSQGPGYGNAFKPNLSAPGSGILSAAVGSGDGLSSKSGTSMASPHVAGAAAVVLEAHPSLTPSAVEALLMNTTVPATPDGSVPLSLQGTGVVRVDNAAIDAEGYASPAGVIFRLNPLSTTTEVTTVDVTRLSGDATYDVTIDSNMTLSGVSWSASASTVTTSGGSGSIDVSVTATPGAMIADDGDSSQSESDGWLVLTNQADSSDRIVVGLVAVADPAADVAAVGGQKKVTLTNSGPATGLAEGFTKVSDGTGVLDAVGYRTAVDPNGGDPFTTIEFGVALDTPWGAPSANEVDIFIDVDQDGTDDWVALAGDLGLLSTGIASGELVTALIELNGPFASFIYFADADFNDEAMVLPLDLTGDFGFLADGDTTPFDVTTVVYDQLGFAGSSTKSTITPTAEIKSASGLSFSLAASASAIPTFDLSGSMLWLFANNQVDEQVSLVSVTTGAPVPNDTNDEMFFYREDGLFRFYDVRPDGTLPAALLEGDGYTTGWDSITAIDLDGDGQDEMFFYREDGLFRFYHVRPDGTLPKALLEGDGYTAGWSSITAIDLDGP